MKAKLKNRDTDGLGLTPEKWYDVLDVECHGEKGRFGEVKKVLIQSEKKREPEWYKAEYFIPVSYTHLLHMEGNLQTRRTEESYVAQDIY